jgi:hypothetical protein
MPVEVSVEVGLFDNLSSVGVCCLLSVQASNADKKECPKCQTKLPTAKTASSGVVGKSRAMGDKSPLAPSASSAMESTGGSCSLGGPHTFKFGMCSKCKVSEGKILKAPGAVANPGGGGSCSKGGKCVFKFTKCQKCGKSEI